MRLAEYFQLPPSEQALLTVYSYLCAPHNYTAHEITLEISQILAMVDVADYDLHHRLATHGQTSGLCCRV